MLQIFFGLTIFFSVLFFICLFVILLTEGWLSCLAAWIAMSTVILFFICMLISITIGIKQENTTNEILAKHSIAFDKASFSVFEAIKAEQDGLPSGGAGKIFLQGSTSVVVSTGNGNVSKGFKAKNVYPLAVALPSDNYILDGSTSANNNRWCFKIKEGERVAYYNENGLVVKSTNNDQYTYFTGLAACLNGVAYGSDGKALL